VGLLAAQVRPHLHHRVPYEIDLRTDQLFIGGAVQTGLFRELSRRGFDMRVAASDDYLGRSHAAPPDAVHLVLSAGRHVDAPVGPGVEKLAHVALASRADVARMHRLDAELHDFLATPTNLTPRGRTLLERASSEPDALVLHRLLDAGNDPQRANDALIAIARQLVRTDGGVFEHLRVADADAHDLVDEYVSGVYLVP